MAQRIKLDLDATDSLDFEREVTLPTPNGKGQKVTFTFKYRNRQEVADLFDGYNRRALAEAAATAAAEERAALTVQTIGQEAPLVVDLSIQGAVRDAIDDDVATVMDMVTGWNLEAEWSRDNVRKLLLRYAGAAVAIVSDYRVSLTQGRLGN